MRRFFKVFAKVLRLLSKRSTGRGISRVVLLGDMFQLPSIQAGKWYKLLQEKSHYICS